MPSSYVPNAPKPKVDWSRDPLELPVASGRLASLEAKLNSILTKVDSMPLADMGVGVKNVLATLNQTLKQADVFAQPRRLRNCCPRGPRRSRHCIRPLRMPIEPCLARIPQLRRICTT